MGVIFLERLRIVIHFNDNTQNKSIDNHEDDHLYNIRPIIAELNEQFLSVPMRPSLFIDEQLWP